MTLGRKQPLVMSHLAGCKTSDGGSKQRAKNCCLLWPIGGSGNDMIFNFDVRTCGDAQFLSSVNKDLV